MRNWLCAMMVVLWLSPFVHADGSDNPGATGPALGTTTTTKPGPSTSGQTSTLNFSGRMTGTFSTDNYANILNTFTSPSVQTLVVGGNTYTVSIGPFSPPSFFERLFFPEKSGQ